MDCVTLWAIDVQITVSGNQISVTDHSSGELLYRISAVPGFV